MPESYFSVRPSTYGTWMPFRSFLVDGAPKPGVELVKQHLEIAIAGVLKFGCSSAFLFVVMQAVWAKHLIS